MKLILSIIAAMVCMVVGAGAANATSIYGTCGDNWIQGGSLAEAIYGYPPGGPSSCPGGADGADTLEGCGGNDYLGGGSGNDVLRARGTGCSGSVNDRDTLIGGSGDDKLAAINGQQDYLDCGAGWDTAWVDQFEVYPIYNCEVIIY